MVYHHYRPLTDDRTIKVIDNNGVSIAANKGMMFNVNIPLDLPQVRGSEEAFNRIFNNVVSNAVKFSKPGGSVNISARLAQDGVAIEASDHWIGISLEGLPYITSKFFRGTIPDEEQAESYSPNPAGGMPNP